MNWLVDMPTEGTFLAVWQYDGKVWGRTFKKDFNTWKMYESDTDSWTIIQNPSFHIPSEVDYGMFVTPTL